MNKLIKRKFIESYKDIKQKKYYITLKANFTWRQYYTKQI